MNPVNPVGVTASLCFSQDGQSGENSNFQHGDAVKKAF
jgi:hypothetical protein